MILQDVLDLVNALRADADSPEGDDQDIMISLIYLSTIEIKLMLNFPFDLEVKTITSDGSSSVEMDSDFEDIVGKVTVGGIEYELVGIDEINDKVSSDRYCYLTYSKSSSRWTLVFSFTPDSGDEIKFTQKVSDSKITDTSATMPVPNDICMYISYDTAARLEWQDDEAGKGEEIKQRRELLLKDLKKKYRFLGNRNNRSLLWAKDAGDGFGKI